MFNKHKKIMIGQQPPSQTEITQMIAEKIIKDEEWIDEHVKI